MGFFSDIASGPIGLVGGGAKDLVGSILGDGHEAVDAQRDAAGQANSTQKNMYDQNRKDLEPWRDAGSKALTDLQDPNTSKNMTMADFQQDPGYAFRMQQGQQALERSAAARGGLNSGATMMALQDYGQQMGSQEYQNAFNRFNVNRDYNTQRLSGLAGIGQNAVSNTVNAGQNYAGQVANNQLGVGNAVAGNVIGNQNRLAGLLGQGIGFAASRGAGGGGAISSDRRVKTNIEEISKADMQELKSHLRPYKFNYVNETFGDGDWLGVMAQDLEKSKLGRTLVFEDTDGVKKIDLKKAVSILFATMAEG
jgi:hypothetical protein